MATNSSWDPEQLRKNAKIWTLEGDANLLNLMKNISNNLEQHAKKTTKNLNEISQKLERTAISLDNTVNRLGMLSQTQFVENRVYDDDEALIKKKEIKNIQKIEQYESKPYDPIETLNTIVKNNMKMLGNCYEKISIDLEDSDDEDSNIKSVIYRPKNPYESQPMPYLIGSREWHEKWHIGLSDSDESEQNSCEDDNISESISLPSNGPTISESGSSVWSLNRQQQQSAKNLSILQKNIANKYSTPLSSDEEISSQTIPSRTCSSAAASRIFNSNNVDSISNLPEQRYYVHKQSKGLFDNHSDSDESVQKFVPQPAPRQNKIPITLPTQISNIFNDEPPELTDPVREETVRNKTNIKIFCDSDEENENLFKKKMGTKGNESISNVTPNIKKKVVNLFDDEDFDSFMKELEKKTTQKASEIDHTKNIPSNDSEFQSEKLNKNNISDIARSLAPNNMEVVSNISKQFHENKIFDDNNDGDELFLPTSKPNKHNNLKTKISNLFDDEPPDDDFDTLFDSAKISTKDKFMNILATKDSSQLFNKNKVLSASSNFHENAASAPIRNILEKPRSSHLDISDPSNQDKTLITNIKPDEIKKIKKEDNSATNNSNKLVDSIISIQKLTNLFGSDNSEDENIFSKKTDTTNPIQKLIISDDVAEKPLEQLASSSNNRIKNIFESDTSEDEKLASKKQPLINHNKNTDNNIRNTESNEKSSILPNDINEIIKTNIFKTSLFDDNNLLVQTNKSNELSETEKWKKSNDRSRIDETDRSVFAKIQPKNSPDKLDKIIKNTAVSTFELPNEIDYNKIKIVYKEKNILETNEINPNNYENENEPEVLSINPNLTKPEISKCVNIEETVEKDITESSLIAEIDLRIPILVNSISEEFNSENLPNTIVEQNSSIDVFSENVINNTCSEDLLDNLSIARKISGEIKLNNDWLDSINKDLNVNTSNVDKSSINFSPHFISNEPPEDLKLSSEITEDSIAEEEDLFASPIKINVNNLQNTSSSALPYNPIGLFQDLPPPYEGDVFLRNECEPNNQEHDSNLKEMDLKNQLLHNNVVNKVPTQNTENKTITVSRSEKINRKPIPSPDHTPNSMVKKLSTNLNINVTALLPGSKRPGYNVIDSSNVKKVEKEEIDGNILIKHQIENKPTNITKSADFLNSGLTHFNKSRPKVSVRRRPQSREARYENYRKSIEIENIIDETADDVKSTNLNITQHISNISNQLNSKNILSNKITRKTNIDNSLKESIAKRKVIFDDTEDQDWFTNIVSTRTEEVNKEKNKVIASDTVNPITDKTKEVSKGIKEIAEVTKSVFSPGIDTDITKNLSRTDIGPDLYPIKSRSFSFHDENSEQNIINAQRDENSLLASKTFIKNKCNVKEIDTEQNYTVPKQEIRSIKDPLFLDSDSEDNDLFNQKSESFTFSSKESIKTCIASALEEPTSFLETSNVEELFKKVKIKPKKNKKDIRPQIKSDSLFSSDEDDDNLFGGTSNKKFSTAKSEQRNSKVFSKKLSSTTRLFDDVDDDDDLFGSGPKIISNKDSIVANPETPRKDYKETISENITKKSTNYNPLADLLHDN